MITKIHNIARVLGLSGKMPKETIILQGIEHHWMDSEIESDKPS